MTTKRVIELLKAADPKGTAAVAIVIPTGLDQDQASRWNIEDVCCQSGLIELHPGVPRW